MKITWRKKKLTFIVIPEATQSSIQFKIPNPILYFIPLLAVAIISALVVLYFVHNNTLEYNSRLALELAQKESSFQQSLYYKERTIDELQSDLLTLSHQAEEIKAKVEELKNLENEIKGITDPIANKSSSVTIASFAQDESHTFEQEYDEVYGIGGRSLPFQDDKLSQLAYETEQEFQVLEQEMELLINSLSKSKEKIIEYQKHLRITPSIWPTVSTRVTSDFGVRRDPFTRRVSNHAGIDIGGKTNDPIFATADGTVHYAGYDRAYGYNIIVQHENGYRTWYMHLNKNLVKQGEKVEQGQEIGKLGSTGRSTGPHLHYEVLKHGTPVDPAPYMQ